MLRFDRTQDRLLALFQQPQLRDAGADAADLLFVEPARLVAAVARDERHRVAFIEQGDGASDRFLVDAELARQAPEVDRNRRCHEEADELDAGCVRCSDAGRRIASIGHLVSSIQHPDCNRPYSAISRSISATRSEGCRMQDAGSRVSTSNAFPCPQHPASCILTPCGAAIALARLSQKLRVVPKLDQSLTDRRCRLLRCEARAKSFWAAGKMLRARDSPPWHVRKHPWPVRTCESIADRLKPRRPLAPLAPPGNRDG